MRRWHVGLTWPQPGRFAAWLGALASTAGCAGNLDDPDAYAVAAIDPATRRINSGDGTQLPVTTVTPFGKAASEPTDDVFAPQGDQFSQSDMLAETDGAALDPVLPELCEAVVIPGCPDVPTKIFADSCGGANCHGDASDAPRGYTDLGHSVGDVATRLLDSVGTSGEPCQDYKIIDTKNPEDSLLIRKLDPVPPCGLNMPFGVYEVSDEDADCIVRWTLAVARGETSEVECP
jgi:hypothetical protein